MFVHAFSNDRQAFVSLEEEPLRLMSHPKGSCSLTPAQHDHTLQDRQGCMHLRLKLKTMTG